MDRLLIRNFKINLIEIDNIAKLHLLSFIVLSPQNTSASTGTVEREASSWRLLVVLGSLPGGVGLLRMMPATFRPPHKVWAAWRVSSVWLIVPSALRATISSGKPKSPARSAT